MAILELQFGLSFSDLLSRPGLLKVQNAFEVFLKNQGGNLYKEYKSTHKKGHPTSEFLLQMAPYLEDFIADLFQIQTAVQKLQQKNLSYAPLATAKRQFIQRRVSKKLSKNPVNYSENSGEKYRQNLSIFLGNDFNFSDLDFSKNILKWLQNPKINEKALDAAESYALWIMSSSHGQDLYKKFHGSSHFFDLPQPLDFDNLIDSHVKIKRQRQGFSLTDKGLSPESSQGQSAYCLLCHERNKDSCRTGLYNTEKKIQKNPLGRDLSGCPLDQKISEMMSLKRHGLTIAALAVVTIDNPLVAATGHRICNDCSAACLFQRQDPVDVPGVETEILRSVLALPWGVEIYTLLTLWNPLRFEALLPKQKTMSKVLVVGLGPAGFTLAYSLAQQGHTVIGIDGTKIEPFPKVFKEKPIHDLNHFFEDLEIRVIDGFGGVAEYGITSRWDKNFLKLIRLILERSQEILIMGGVRFGSSLTPQQGKYDYGFDHIALCNGAGQPNIIPLENMLVKGVRQASDFLMALQLTGAYKKKALANLEVNLPIIVIGGGLTSIDTATEALAYYPVQVEKFLSQLEELDISIDDLNFTESDFEKATLWVKHAKILRQERTKKSPDFQNLLQSWGGATVLYRKALTKAPSYRLNVKEIEKALEEGIKIAPYITPQKIQVDKYGEASGVLCTDSTGKKHNIHARSIFMATGILPNTTLAKEYPPVFNMDGIHYKPSKLSHFLMVDPYYSFFGDLHPTYKGSVVKAIASAKKGALEIDLLLTSTKPRNETKAKVFWKKFRDDFQAHIISVKRKSDHEVELLVKAPMATKNHKPGQFFRLQNFTTYAPEVKNISLSMEGLALTAHHIDAAAGIITFKIVEQGATSRICAFLKPNTPVILMGPLGTPTFIPRKEEICLISQWPSYPGVSLLVKALTKAPNKVIVFEGKEINELEVNDLNHFDRFMVFGNGKFMGQINKLLKSKKLRPKNKKIATVNSPMQCMMKEICGQCLQRHVHPKTGVETYVYSCMTQEQPLSSLDTNFLKNRLTQNSLQENITNEILKKYRQ